MTSTSIEIPASKRARVEEDEEAHMLCTSKRTEELTHKIQDLAKSFPELKYIIDLSGDLSKIVEPAVIKYKYELESKKNEENSLIYKLPDEILKSCFSFVGQGNFLLVAPVSKKFHHMYKKMFEGEYNGTISGIRKKWRTYYSVATTNISTSKYCLDIMKGRKDSWCHSYRENMAKFFAQAACKGQIDTLKLANHFDISCFWEEDDKMQSLLRRPIEKIAELGHLNVLQFFHDNFNMRFALPMASRGAAFGGQIHILKWLKENNILIDIKEGQKDTLCYSALTGGQLATLQWLRQEGFNLSERIIEARSPFELGIMATAIKSGNIELIEYCNDQGFSFEVRSSYRRQQCDCLAIATGNIDLIRYCSELGCEFTERVLDCAYEHINVDSLKFLRSKSLPWPSETIDHAAELNQFEVLKYAYENGSEWSEETWQYCLKQKPRINWDMVHYLYENKCPWEPELDLKDVNDGSHRLRILEFISSKKLSLDVQVLFDCIDKKWMKETKFIIENTGFKVMPESLAYIAEKSNCNLETVKYLHSKGIPFGKGFLRQISWDCEMLIWALENGCSVEDTEELYQVFKDSHFSNKKLLNLLLCYKKFSDLDLVVERIIKNNLYREGLGLEQFQLFLDHGCSMSVNVVKMIYKYWLVLHSSDEYLDELVEFISSSNHSEPSIDELYTYYEDDLHKTDSDDEESNDDGEFNFFRFGFGF